ncbi:MAG: hypothetical protein D6798_04645 [Deltaproteobacteria bacterium]|nr:MAG: hypothetical protein D6798_04645 [Deltaproteobacteria bacterium]
MDPGLPADRVSFVRAAHEQRATGIADELLARNILLPPDEVARLEKLERRRWRFRRQLRRGPDILRPAGPPNNGQSSVVKGLGLNVTQAYACNLEGLDKFGAGHSQLRDWQQLGAAVGRQVGPIDLLWGMMADADVALSEGLISDVTETVPIPFESGDVGGEPADEYYVPGPLLDALIVSDANIARFANFFIALAQRQRKVILTFLTLGSGGTTLSCTVTREDGGVDYAVRNPARLVWHEDHEGKTLPPARAGESTEDDSAAFDLYPGVTCDGLSVDRATLDPFNVYKRRVLAAIGDRAVRLLVAAMERVRRAIPDAVLGDIVAAIEIFNEVTQASWLHVDAADATDATVNMALAGQAWGAIWFRVARSMHKAFNELGAFADRVPLHLPGIDSWWYDENGYYPRSWADKVDFLGAMLDEIRDRAEAWEADDGPAGAFRVLVGGVDLHWYHKEQPQTLSGDEVRGGSGGAEYELTGYTHIGFLYLELAELRDLFDRDRYGLTDASISVFEAGMSASLVNWHYPSSTATDPKDLIPPTDFIPAAFQDDPIAWKGFEVWRRLGAALAGAADAAGWHSWMSGESVNFQGMGLRRDAEQVGGSADDPEWAPIANTADTAGSTPRLAWYAYQRLADRLAGGVVSGQMILPAVTTRDDLVDYLGSRAPLGSTWTNSAALVVFEYVLDDPTWSYAYLVFVEPVYLEFLVEGDPTDDPVVSPEVGHPLDGTATVRVSPVSGTALSITQVDCLASLSSVARKTPAGLGPCDPLPFWAFTHDSAPFHDDVVISLDKSGTDLHFFLGSRIDTLGPKLYLSPERLSWAPEV